MEKEYFQEYYQKNKDKIIQRTRAWKLAHPIPRKRNPRNPNYVKEWRERNPGWQKKVCEKRKLERKERKLKIILAYGGKCSCCGEGILEFLTLEHKNGGGYKERKKLNGSQQLYEKLIKENYPDGYDILCFNCNMAKGLYGICPHKNTNI